MKIIYASAQGPKPSFTFEYIVTFLASTVVDKPLYSSASGHHFILHFMLQHEQLLVLVLSILSSNSTQLSPPGLYSFSFYILSHVQTAEPLSVPINIRPDEANSLACQI